MFELNDEKNLKAIRKYDMKVTIQVRINNVDKRIEDAISIPGSYGWLVENAMEGIFSKEVEKLDMPNIESKLSEMGN